MQTYIYIEPSDDEIDATATQIASKLRKLSPELRGPILGIDVADSLKDKESQLSGLLDELLVIEIPHGNEHNTEVIANILTDIVGEQGPAMLFFGFTHQGMELAPAVGWRLGVPVATACVDFELDGGKATIKRQIVGGKLFISSSVTIEHGAVFSVQKGAWKDEVEADIPQAALSITHLAWKESWSAEKTKVLRIFEEAAEGEEDITKAEILLSVGRGLGDPDNLSTMEELARSLGAVLSCSRPVVDAGWLPASRQVGISGKTVAPVIYLALGISGQTNHIAGMDASGTIIAINKDPLAPIFTVAQYGIVDDILEFAPELIEQIKKQGAS